MKINTIIVTLLLVAGWMGSSYGQNYQSAAGIRAGFPLSVSYKTFLNESSAIEGYVGARFFSGYNWYSISGAYQIHKPLGDTEGLQFYFGGGASVFLWSFGNSFFGAESYSSTTFGVQGYLGLDYALPDTPLNFTLDWVPTVFINGFGSGFGGGYGALGIRYIISR